MTAFAIGTPVIDPYGTRGFISAAFEPESKVYILGAGMEPVRHEYEICYDSGRISRLSDGIVKPFVERAKHLPAVENVDARRAEIQAMHDAAQAQARLDADAAQARREAFRLEAQSRVPSWAKAVIVAEYTVDRSDSMTDYFGSTTARTVILGYSKHTRDLFPELRKFAATFDETKALENAPDKAEHREKYSMGAGFYLKDGYRNSTGWQVRKLRLHNGAASMPDGAEWLPETDKAETTPAPAAPSVDGMHIEEHAHTKGGFQMFIAIMPGRVERAEYDRLLAAAKALGGWYSRPWGKTPGGFAFKDRAAAESFVGAGAPVDADAAPEPVATNPARPIEAKASPAIGDKLRDIADRMQGEIDSKMRDRLTNTPKRRREADAARIDGYHFQRAQQALRALAMHHHAGTVPAVLSRVTTKAKVLELTKTVIDHSRGGYYDAGIDTGKPSHTTPDAVALWEMITGQSEADKQAETLRRKVDALQFANIPGYFPTPSDIVADMIERADIPDASPVEILEPEGGSGGILDVIKAARPLAKLTTYERHESLRDVLQMKGYTLAGSDFLEAPAAPSFDYVLMNPPFENGQDMAHVRHAFEFLKPGGRLVAIMSPGPFFRSDRKAAEFRTWFDELGGEKVDLPAGSFKASGTGVATVLITLDR